MNKKIRDTCIIIIGSSIVIGIYIYLVNYRENRNKKNFINNIRDKFIKYINSSNTFSDKNLYTEKKDKAKIPPEMSSKDFKENYENFLNNNDMRNMNDISDISGIRDVQKILVLNKNIPVYDNNIDQNIDCYEGICSSIYGNEYNRKNIIRSNNEYMQLSNALPFERQISPQNIQMKGVNAYIQSNMPFSILN